MNRVARSLTTILAILGLALLMPVSSVAAAGGCSLTVSPTSGPPGTGFVFRGKGFTPTTLIMTRGNEAPKTYDIPAADISGTSFRFPLLAEDPNVGKWRVRAAGCDDIANMRVTLPPTATQTETTTTPPQDDTTQLAGLTLLGVLFLGATALFLPRLTRAARAG
jgi:hypothetical protein